MPARYSRGHLLQLTCVKPSRPDEFLTAMKSYKGYNVACARGLILRRHDRVTLECQQNEPPNFNNDCDILKCPPWRRLRGMYAEKLLTCMLLGLVVV